MKSIICLLQASTDQSAVDIDIPFQAGSLASSVVHLLGIIVVMSQVAWQVFIVFVPITAISIWYQVIYLAPCYHLPNLFIML